MKITKVEIIPVNVPLEQPIGHAFYKRTSGKHMIVKIYDDAFGNYKFGYASAEAWVLFIIIFAATLLQFWVKKKWVYD